ncbi:MAG: beta-propeller domain-containing protein [Acidimicrobiales bacterium]
MRSASSGNDGGRRGRRGRAPRRRAMGLALGAALVVGACTGTDGPAGGPGEQAAGRSTATTAAPNLDVDVALEPTDSCDALLRWFHDEAVAHLGSPGYPGSGRSSAGGGALEDQAASGPPTTSVAPSARSEAGAPSASAEADRGDAAAGAAAPTPSYSDTNNQTKGVDEADLTKTDGRRLFGVVDGDVVAWDLTGASPKQVGRLRLETGGDSQLLLDGDRLLVVTSGGPSTSEPMPLIDELPADAGAGRTSGTSGTTTPNRQRPALREGPATVLTLVDVRDPSTPTVLRRVALEGATAGARSVDGTARIAVSTPPPDLPLVYPSSRRAEDAAKEANRRIIEETTIEDWIPQWVDLGASGIPDPGSLEGRPLLDCTAVERPKASSGVGMLSLVTVDLDGALEPGDAVGVVGAGETVYASPRNVYVTTTELADEPTRRAGNGVVAVASTRTAVHKFGIEGDGPATYRASGGVAGRLLNQFSMDEAGDDLRLASTVDSIATGRNAQSQVVVLRERDGELRQVGAVGGLGKGEQIKSVRFIGDVGYVVTFRQTDPLYTVDLRDPSNPKVAGELKILGYSAYLHPAGEGRLIGVGQDATATGRATGTQVALFDVSDPADPRQLQKYALPGSTSSAEQEHHAFLWWPATDLAVLPVTTSGGVTPLPSPCPAGARCTAESAAPYRQGFVGALGLRVTGEGITEVGRIVNPVDGVPAFGPDRVAAGSTSTTATPPTTDGSSPVPPSTIPCDPACPPPGSTATTAAASATTTTSVDPAVREAARLAGDCDAAGNCPPADGGVPAPTTVLCDPACPPPTPKPTTPPGPDYSGAGAPILRAMVVGDRVLTLSETGLRTGHLDDLTFVAWEPLR